MVASDGATGIASAELFVGGLLVDSINQECAAAENCDLNGELSGRLLLVNPGVHEWVVRVSDAAGNIVSEQARLSPIPFRRALNSQAISSIPIHLRRRLLPSSRSQPRTERSASLESGELRSRATGKKF